MVCGEGLGLICGVCGQGEYVGKRRAGQGEEDLRVRGLGGVIRVEDQGGG